MVLEGVGVREVVEVAESVLVALREGVPVPLGVRVAMGRILEGLGHTGRRTVCDYY